MERQRALLVGRARAPADRAAIPRRSGASPGSTTTRRDGRGARGRRRVSPAAQRRRIATSGAGAAIHSASSAAGLVQRRARVLRFVPPKQRVAKEIVEAEALLRRVDEVPLRGAASRAGAAPRARRGAPRRRPAGSRAARRGDGVPRARARGPPPGARRPGSRRRPRSRRPTRIPADEGRRRSARTYASQPSAAARIAPLFAAQAAPAGGLRDLHRLGVGQSKVVDDAQPAAHASRAPATAGVRAGR